eukprot:CAMPEP_0184980048 /NCGR_PEP_ID=MMETSP1098-20130426/10095_1 /TAXON_ID=89044 /ORGANISM="Spumella elongata, Strain CCAP 955/1" /LENGTH=70 /DNA_ID=CAMNT_0027503405 /DNA_START=1 /DNA_END=213 /DNA_ORIENTATION=-
MEQTNVQLATTKHRTAQPSLLNGLAVTGTEGIRSGEVTFAVLGWLLWAIHHITQALHVLMFLARIHGADA